LNTLERAAVVDTATLQAAPLAPLRRVRAASPRPEPRVERPRLVVVLSPERSGSTLLSVMLGAHGDVLAPPELHLLRYPTFEAWRSAYPAAMASLRWLVSSLVGEIDDLDLIRMFSGKTTHEVYAWLLGRRRPGQIVIDKTPAYSRDLESLERVESFEPSYIWLVRHPLGVAASKIDALHKQRRLENTRTGARIKYPLYQLRRGLHALSGSELRRHVDYWAEVHGRIGAFLATIEPERQCMVHYERLVHDPYGEVKQVAERIQVETIPEMLEPWQHAPAELEWGIGDEKVLQARSINSSRADAWRSRFRESSLSEEVRALLEELKSRPTAADAERSQAGRLFLVGAQAV
jgi:LPS sulfotransferase NodH